MERTEEIRPYDVIVVGAGAAGMMAAGTAAQRGCRVLLLEKDGEVGPQGPHHGKGALQRDERPAGGGVRRAGAHERRVFRPGLRRLQQPRGHPFLRAAGRPARHRARRTRLSPQRQGVGYRQRPAGLLRGQRGEDSLRHARYGDYDPRRPGLRREVRRSSPRAAYPIRRPVRQATGMRSPPIWDIRSSRCGRRSRRSSRPIRGSVSSTACCCAMSARRCGSTTLPCARSSASWDSRSAASRAPWRSA